MSDSRGLIVLTISHSSTAELQAPGTIRRYAYLSGNTTHGAVVHRVDDLSVGPLDQ